jgi:hypothetical protein
MNGRDFFMDKNNEGRVLKRSVCKEELWVLCDYCWQEAIILNQLLYWTQNINQSDELIRQQVATFKKMGMEKEANEIAKLIRNGWFYKDSKELADELMQIKKTQVNKYLNQLEEKKFFKSVPFSPTKRTRYIKVNVRYIRDELAKLGYTLEGFVFDDEVKPQENSQSGNRKSEISPIRIPDEDENIENPSDEAIPETGKAEFSHSGNRKSEISTTDAENPSDEAIPETGKAESSHSENRTYTKNTDTQNTSVLSVVSVMSDIQKLFFDKMGVELSYKEAESLILTAVDTGKDIEEAIDETIRYFELSKKKVLNPVGSVIYAMTKGWDLESLEKEQDKESKILQFGKRMKSGKKSKPSVKPGKLPQALQQQMGEEQPEHVPTPEEVANKHKSIQEKLRKMNERLQQKGGKVHDSQ